MLYYHILMARPSSCDGRRLNVEALWFPGLIPMGDLYLERVPFKMKSRRNPSPKRCIRAKDPSDRAYVERLKVMADTVTYGGNPEHKRNPGDFGLDPPSLPRQGKTLCDGANIFSRADALSLLRQGIVRGLVSKQERGAPGLRTFGP